MKHARIMYILYTLAKFNIAPCSFKSNQRPIGTTSKEPSIPPEPVVCLEKQNQQSIIQCLDALNQH
jgi:hypothetical protein